MAAAIAQAADVDNLAHSLHNSSIVDFVADDDEDDDEHSSDGDDGEFPSSGDDDYYYSLYSDSEDDDPPIPPGLPILPEERKHELSPSVSHENLTMQGCSSSSSNGASGSTSTSTFFHRLPLEIRHKIYISAFGERTIHMDLNFDSPGVRGVTHEVPDMEKCNPEFGTEPLPAEWIWSSSTCHRNPMAEGCHDQCRIGGKHTMCSLFPGNALEKCNLGVMGWLLTCRQAYAETINVLYGSNTVHIASFAMMKYLPMFILPQRLYCIKSLELIWDLLLFSPILSSGMAQLLGWPVYFDFIRSTILNFPHLKTLYISIQIGTHLDDQERSLERVEQKLFAPLDEIVKLAAGGRLEFFQVAIPTSFHTALVKKAEKSGGVDIESGGEDDIPWKRYWRPVKLDQEVQPAKNLGYWIRQGVDDAHLKQED